VVVTQPETPAADAYLRSLWRLRRAKITTAQELAREAAQDTLRLPDGTETALGPWLSAELKKMK
jgi:hypothetical protein